uniref:probable proline--tRNA ligase, mitochondrial n=1 Tax=Ciona intestinalis TaxID=7719 RepID=UPI000180B0C7|nr:probable proline--tRNA ligase, mitochondrial [Ciona intestinalis]|eukprot:XP_009858012.1 probable proline--tRNA ligase, mitochondrial [Ciona intestinalis]
MRRVLTSKTFPISNGSVHMQENIISTFRASDSRSANLLLQSSFISPSSKGIYHFMPPLVKSLEKLTSLIDEKMKNICAQKVQMSMLSGKDIWSLSGRWDAFGKELITTNLGEAKHCLSPTHEEAVCKVLSQTFNKFLSYRHLPLRLYQTNTKFRNEPDPQRGLLRCREFLMNDLYTFDTTKKAAVETYNAVCNIYEEFFKELNIPVTKAQAGSGLIGGDFSHEYHILAGVGEDNIFICPDTGQAWNSECTNIEKKLDTLKQVDGIEVGHTFYLGKKYSKMFKTSFLTPDSKPVPCEMGCYGLGVTRILAACLEVLSTESGMRWPHKIAPYKVCLVLPKTGSKEFENGTAAVNNVFDKLQNYPLLKNDVIIDDTPKRSIGWKTKHANLIGYPLVIVFGKGLNSEEQYAEVIIQNPDQQLTKHVPLQNVVEFIHDYF